MNMLIGKVNNCYKKILSRDENIYNNSPIDNLNCFDYSTSYILEEEEWYKITQFSQKTFFIDECKSNYNTVNLNQITNNDYDKLSCFCEFSTNIRYFQRVTPSLYINKKTILDYSGDPRIVEYNKQIVVTKTPDAIYNTENDTLLFKDLSKIKSIFPGIEVLQREATQPEVDDFLNSEHIALDRYNSRDVGIQNRKRIADIGAKFNALTADKKNSLIEYAREKTGIEYKDGAFVISSDTHLKNLLFAMDQRYYYADIYGENRVANSIRVVAV